ncbi:hypothetical protein F444_19379 [Phytophthora nicotianae P1976]|uniref:Uncharacterized protein n=1 Tax=Phytophthora nicotianae P1976 TaxID=1317066 RepID=A0A080Z813_PHYNI|nr:hypothetical protein F444_19379 [Phytophthora nicotianae P1976]
MSSGDDALAKLRARMAQPPKDWVDVVMVAVLKDPMFYGVLGLSIFLIAAEDKLKERQKSKKQQ